MPPFEAPSCDVNNSLWTYYMYMYIKLDKQKRLVYMYMYMKVYRVMGL